MIDIHVDQIMTEEPKTVQKSQTLAEAGGVMLEAGIKSVIVSGPDGCPVGILTSSDFLQTAADGTVPTEMRIEEYMTRDIVTTTPDTAVNEAADRMLENNISHLPVVRDGGRLIGIVSTTDVAAYVSGTSKLLEVG